MPEVTPTPRDPAPSRLEYRIQRLALTPLVRRLFFVGLPLATVAFILGLAVADAERRAGFAAWVEEVKQDIRQRDEFMVRELAIEGASDDIARDIREILSLKLPTSSFDLDLPLMQSTVASLDAVKRADLRVRSGGILNLQIEERVPALVWRTPDGLDLLDANGRRTATIANRAARSDLPLIIGEGAERAAPEALDLVAAAQPLAGRVRALVRVGQRRWSIVLDRDQRIELPETGAVEALERVIATDAAEDLLSRDLTQVDMRLPQRPTVRLVPETARALRTAKLQELGED